MAWIMMMDVARCSLFGGWRHGREQLEFRRPPAERLSLSLSLSLSLHVRLLHLDINMHPFEHSDVIIK
jgi:hypothetical protein